MHRREALKSLAIITGGAVLVPSCNFEKEDILSAYQNLSVTESMRNVLAQIADTIIPAGSIQGAGDLAVQDFILVMVNDCVQADQQDMFTKGLQGFDDFSKEVVGSKFSKLEQTDKEKVVTQGLSISDEDADEGKKTMLEFLRITKRFTIQGYMMSEYIMTQVKPYHLIPGEYNGAVLINSISTPKING
ncbi:MAG: gluconate 2-dehydrogenase subunit 3 family protein [Bacteroidetes bacterium CHB5]|nr:gluconate 2-dehydrogenase subunit 3 family protein [Bacteroidetes bacterium CHB5]